MALSYVLEIETNIKAKILSSIINNQFSINQNELLIIVDEMEVFDIDVTESLFNFRPNLAVIFRINSNSPSINFKLIAQISLFILQEIIGNAILLFNEEVMIMQRINEQLIFNQKEWQILSGVDINNIMLKAMVLK